MRCDLTDTHTDLSTVTLAVHARRGLMILLKAMFNPEFKGLLNLATDLRNASSKGVQIIGTIMLNSMVSAVKPLNQLIMKNPLMEFKCGKKRYLFQDGDPIKGRHGDEGGWLEHSGFTSPKVVGADANYYNRAYWKILYQGKGKYFIENVKTKRYLFQDGECIIGKCGFEGGWLKHSGLEAPKVVGADTNYYNHAYWYIITQGNGMYFIENVETKRYLFQDGEPVKGKRGAECGWLAHSGFESPKAVGADANYYNHAYFKLLRVQ